MARYGSLQNHLMGNGKSSLVPTVGLGVTRIMWSDRQAYTVTEVLTPKRIVVQRDTVKRADDNGMSEIQNYVFSANPDGERVTLTLRSNGRWAEIGVSSKGGGWVVGVRSEYHDFSF